MRAMTETKGKDPRYAIYFSPGPDTLLCRLGSKWLGRDAATGEPLEPHLPEGFQRGDWFRATESPRRYGFHATLKPPFYLADGRRLGELYDALGRFADAQKRFTIPCLKVGTLGRFLAMILTEPSNDFHELAAASIREFECFRAPATKEDLARRLHDDMPERERKYLIQWGYPYVFDAWKFHMTLTNSLRAEDISRFNYELQKRFDEACKELTMVDSICLFEEPQRGEKFHLMDRFFFGGE